ncbi:MAG TPA: hypothetical protein VHX15_20310 [Frankiaceae bacterium]|nr:hypothetical protein [Frankiaceae bacterium]
MSDQLSDLGCSSAEGFFVSRPLPPEQFERWLVEHKTSKVLAAQA